jgi:hypothetical protein
MAAEALFRGDKNMKSYDVGYRKPPREKQFSKGRSGNPTGRPKGAKNLKTDLEEELKERISVKIGGRSAKLTKQRALIKTILSRAIGGDSKSTSAALALMLRILDPAAASPDAVELSRNDQAILDLFLERQMRVSSSSGGNR